MDELFLLCESNLEESWHGTCFVGWSFFCILVCLLLSENVEKIVSC